MKNKTSSNKQVVKPRHKTSKESIRREVLQDLAQSHEKRLEKNVRVYRFGFWLFFILVIFSVAFSVVAITSIYNNFQVVTKILDESFERTNLVLDITSSKISSCESELQQCKSGGLPNGSAGG